MKPPTLSATVELTESSQSSSQPITDSDSDFEIRKRVVKKRQIDYGRLALECDKTGVSSRTGASIATAATIVLEKEGLIENAIAVKETTLRRRRSAERKKLQTEQLPQKLIVRGLYYDGRKDTTLGASQRTIKEDHYVLLQEPGNNYLGHVSPSSGKAEAISDAIWTYLKSKEVDLDKVQCLGCDGTNTNTGVNHGVNRRLEEMLGRPVQWCVCMLHGNELPFQHLFEHLDGTRKSPNSYSGPIGKALEDCEKLPIVRFEPIPATYLPDIDSKDLSSD